MKKSFILYNDITPMVDKLSDDMAGKLFKHILDYAGGGNPPDSDDLLLSIAFEPIKQSLLRDEEKYQKIVKRNQDNGKKGGRPRNPDNPVGSLVTQDNPDEPRKADSDSDSGNDSDSDNDNDKAEGKPSLSKVTPLDEELAEHLSMRIKENNPGAKCDQKKWADIIRLMRTRDKRTGNGIRKVIDFATNDSFWMGNILSAASLRKQYDQLWIKLNKGVNIPGNGKMNETVDALQRFIDRGENGQADICERDCGSQSFISTEQSRSNGR